MKPKLVIFDCDGVLVDSEHATNEVLIASLALYGLSVSMAECMQFFVGGTLDDVAVNATKMGAKLPQNWIAETRDLFHDRLHKGVPLVPGISALLDLLDRAEIAFCVASNGPTEKMKITLGQNGLWDRFQERMFSGPALGTTKPDPGLFLLAAKTLGFDPTDCVVIEDSLSGATAARRAHMRCLGYVPEGDVHGVASEGAELFTSMDNVAKLLEV